jgi:hypothetical protein
VPPAGWIACSRGLVRAMSWAGPTGGGMPRPVHTSLTELVAPALEMCFAIATCRITGIAHRPSRSKVQFARLRIRNKGNSCPGPSKVTRRPPSSRISDSSALIAASAAGSDCHLSTEAEGLSSYRRLLPSPSGSSRPR